jgi:hypothetical protein
LVKLNNSELLYRAFRQLCPENKVSAADIKFPDISVNRASLSKPEDLLNSKTQPIGVCSFLVSGIPSGYSDSNINYNFVAVEDPLPDNPAHAEIRTLVNGVHSSKEPPKRIKRQFRIDLSNEIKIVIFPI